MNRKQSIAITAIGVGMLVLGLLLGRILFATHSDSHSTGHEHAGTLTGDAPHVEDAAIWMCSMHPQIRQPESGQCPICGMNLIPIVDNDSADEGSRMLTMSKSARALAEIETSPVIRAFPEMEVRLVGMLDYDETRLRSLTARFPARIDELFVNFTGIQVNKGDHLAMIYSPDMLTAQRELLTALEYESTGSTARVAREKLRLWDFQPDQVDAIISSGEALAHIELRAPIGGIVVQKNIKEGDYVNTGDSLFRIADLTRLWLPLEAYESDLPWVRYGQKVEFKVESFPGEQFEGRIVFIAPTLDTKTRTVDVRVEVSNLDGRLKPGMFARATVYSQLASGGRVVAPELAGKWIGPMHPEIVKDGPGSCDVCGMDLVPIESLGFVTESNDAPPLLVPTSAVLRTGKRAVVYVAVMDRETPTYEGREITIGPRAGNVFLVLEGLHEGEQVVTNGAFKIDSALQILAKPSMMSPSGGP
jgi:Cu(I)/Ag(I) efflux system membrane fusion protein